MFNIQLRIDFEDTVKVGGKPDISQGEANKRYFDLLEETYAKDDDEPWWMY